MSALREIVADLEPILPPAEVARGASGKVVRESEKYFCPECLQKGAPGFTGQRGLERADALRRDDRNALGLTGKTEEFHGGDGHANAEQDSGKDPLRPAFSKGERQARNHNRNEREAACYGAGECLLQHA